MHLRLKNSNVTLYGLSLEAVTAIERAMRVWNQHGMQSLTITSARDGNHMEGSKHYTGDAIDLRIWSIPDPTGMRDELQTALGDDYDVILETDHIHVEWDPVL